MPKKALGGHHHQGALRSTQSLPSQEAEVLGRCGGVRHPHVVLGAQLEEPFQAGAGVLRPLALEAVGKEHDQAGALAPLGETGGDELIDDDLGHIDEVAELGFPEDHLVLGGHLVAVLEPQHGRLGERGVVHLEAGVADARQRNDLPARLHIVKNQVPLAEGAPLRVLPGDADRHALPEERPQGQRLGVGPFEGEVGSEIGSAPVQLSGELRVRQEALRPGQSRLVHLHQILQGSHLLSLAHRLGLRRFPIQLRRLLRLSLDLLPSPTQPVGDRVLDLLHPFLGNDAIFHQAPGPERARGGVGGDTTVEQRLRVRRLVTLVVPVPAVADQVDDHVVVKVSPVGHGEAYRAQARLGIVTIHVDDGDVVSLGEVAGVARRAGLRRLGREAHLVVHDHVHGAAGPVSFQPRQVEGLGHHALRREGSVSVQEDGNHRGHVLDGVPHPVLELAGPGHPLHHRIHELQVTRVGRHGHGDLRAVG